MSSPIKDQTVPATRRPRTRKSVASLPLHEFNNGQDDKENLHADDGSVDPLKSATAATIASSKKTRSKSIGPGGLDALRETEGNRKRVAAIPPKSILKPSIPLSPLKEIPSRTPSTSQRKSVSPSKSPRSATKVQSGYKPPASPVLIATTATDVAHDGAKEIPNTTATEKPEPELLKKQREARRKSLANRRVSFAPEATLHTWDVVEYMQDATTSSTSNDTTRRSSGISNVHNTTGSDSDGPPSTPPEQIEDSPRKTSPAHQRNLHQKKRRRRSSSGPAKNFTNDEEVWSSSPYSGSSEGANDGDVAQSAVQLERVNGNELPSGAKDIFIDAPPHDSPSPRTTSASQQGVDQDGDVTMEMVENETTTAFQPWSVHSEHEDQGLSDSQTYSETKNYTNGVHEDLSMDMTQAVGSILPVQVRQNGQNKTGFENRRDSAIDRRRSLAAGNDFEDDSMDLTTAIGGIEHQKNVASIETQSEQDEDLSMDFTAVFGGMRQDGNNQLMPSSTRAATSEVDHSQQDGASVLDEKTETMDMTMAVGSIVTTNAPVTKSALATPVGPSNKGKKGGIPFFVADTAISGLPESKEPTGHGVHNNEGTLLTPQKAATLPGTPTKQITPKPARPTTPGKTPPSKNVALRNPSPKRLFETLIKNNQKSPNRESSSISSSRTPPAPRLSTSARLSAAGIDREGLGSPQVSAKLDRRASIAEQTGVFTLNDVSSRAVRFDNPKSMEEEVIQSREEDIRRESAQFIIEREVDGGRGENDVTANLKNMIHKLTPKKSISKGRKSLALGSAKGLLGKRPAELDDDETEASPREHVYRQESPVKKIRLQSPPSKLQTTGRQGSVLRPVDGFQSTPKHGYAPATDIATTPKDQARFVDAEMLSNTDQPIPSMGDSRPSTSIAAADEQPISLQDFLNLTNIRFMELNTTKRRHTVAPGSAQKPSAGKEAQETQLEPAKHFEDCVVAGACTVPLLELYQHSCRELKKYISEGRNIVREIEADTVEENPRVFRIYQSAAPHERHLMDNQFKHMKFNARLVSKGMWYEWRMKLLEGLRVGLDSISEGMKGDESTLVEHEDAITAALPLTVEEQQQLRIEYEELETRARELEDCDQEELANARLELNEFRERISSAQRKTEEIANQELAMKTSLNTAKEAKEEKKHSIKEAYKVRDEHRGWSTNEVAQLKANVVDLERKYGWAITSASSTTLTMVYRQQLQVFFDVASFLPKSCDARPAKLENSPISLTYIGDRDPPDPCPLTTERRFFLQLMQVYLHSITQGETRVRDMLGFISNAWHRADTIQAQVRRLNAEYRTHSTITADDRLSIQCSILLQDVKTKILVDFSVQAILKSMLLGLKVASNATVVYGERFREDKMNQFLRGRVVAYTADENDIWVDIVRDLQKRLLSGGKKV